MKFLQTLGLYTESNGGHLWIIRNPEDLGGAEDYIYDGNRNQRLNITNQDFQASANIPIKKTGRYVIYEVLT